MNVKKKKLYNVENSLNIFLIKEKENARLEMLMTNSRQSYTSYQRHRIHPQILQDPRKGPSRFSQR